MAEVLAAMAAQPDQALLAKFRAAVDVVERAIAIFGYGGLALSFNSGKDSTAILHIVRAAYASTAQASGKNEDPPALRAVYFDQPCQFQEIEAFTHATAARYALDLRIYKTDFIAGISELLATTEVKAILIGTRMGGYVDNNTYALHGHTAYKQSNNKPIFGGRTWRDWRQSMTVNLTCNSCLWADPNARGQETFSPSSRGWPAFMRVNPVLSWSYTDVWSFLRACDLPYCELYDRGYTSIGNTTDTVPNDALKRPDLSFGPAHLLRDGSLERAGRKQRSIEPEVLPVSNGGGPGTIALIMLHGAVRGEARQDDTATLDFLCEELRGLGLARVILVPTADDADAEARRLASLEHGYVVLVRSDNDEGVPSPDDAGLFVLHGCTHEVMRKNWGLVRERIRRCSESIR